MSVDLFAKANPIMVAGRQPTSIVPPLNPSCVACGPTNPRGLRIDFRQYENLVSATWSPTEDWASFPRTIHGGIVTTVLDEAMSKAIIAMGREAFTVELRVRFHHVVRPGRTYAIKAWVVDQRKRRIRTEAILSSPDGMEQAHAWASFLQV